jgi:hypothetical protein
MGVSGVFLLSPVRHSDRRPYLLTRNRGPRTRSPVRRPCGNQGTGGLVVCGRASTRLSESDPSHAQITSSIHHPHRFEHTRPSHRTSRPLHFAGAPYSKNKLGLPHTVPNPVRHRRSTARAPSADSSPCLRNHRKSLHIVYCSRGFHSEIGDRHRVSKAAQFYATPKAKFVFEAFRMQTSISKKNIHSQIQTPDTSTFLTTQYYEDFHKQHEQTQNAADIRMKLCKTSHRS